MYANFDHDSHSKAVSKRPSLRGQKVRFERVGPGSETLPIPSQVKILLNSRVGVHRVYFRPRHLFFYFNNMS